jgi:hypothetical protein
MVERGQIVRLASRETDVRLAFWLPWSGRKALRTESLEQGYWRSVGSMLGP